MSKKIKDASVKMLEERFLILPRVSEAEEAVRQLPGSEESVFMLGKWFEDKLGKPEFLLLANVSVRNNSLYVHGNHSDSLLWIDGEGLKDLEFRVISLPEQEEKKYRRFLEAAGKQLLS